VRQGLAEYVLVTAFLALAAAGAVAIFGDEIRAGLGVGGEARPAGEVRGSGAGAGAPQAPPPRP
jgi:hypothetical protein